MMAVHLSTWLYLFVAMKKLELRLFDSLSKNLQSFWGVTATTSQAILVESCSLETTLTKHVPHNIRGF